MTGYFTSRKSIVYSDGTRVWVKIICLTSSNIKLMITLEVFPRVRYSFILDHGSVRLWIRESLDWFRSEILEWNFWVQISESNFSTIPFHFEQFQLVLLNLQFLHPSISPQLQSPSICFSILIILVIDLSFSSGHYFHFLSFKTVQNILSYFASVHVQSEPRIAPDNSVHGPSRIGRILVPGSLWTVVRFWVGYEKMTK